MLDFLLQNWKIIICSILIIVNIILTIVFKKTKVTDNVLTFLMSVIPTLINKVESPGNGEEKCLAVVSWCVALLQDKFGFSVDQAQTYVPKIKEFIEKILSTPQKKGN